MSERKRNVLVTGGAGYVGSVMVGEFLRRGFRVTVLDDFRFSRTSLLHLVGEPGLEVVRGDVRDRSLLKPLVAAADVIVPLAAVVGAPACSLHPGEARSVNTGAVRLLNDLRSRSQPVLFPVTNSGYGIGEKGVYCDENTPLRPISLYGKTKVEAEKLLMDKGGVVAFRLATAFGVSPRMRVDLLVNDFTYRAVKDRCVVLFEEHFKRNYIHVRDIARAFLFGLERFGTMKDQAYNVGLSNANLSKLELCRVIKKHVPELVIITSDIGRDPDRRDYIVSNAKIEAAGFKPRYSLDYGIRTLIKAYGFIKNSIYDNQ
ncbi:MAG TPA: NAD(P)-dependent oxidoreductase [bacterium]|nr:NAD(P)-dependent oxidoreductase [bacterium]HPJ71722.1 NAD(P)-dependent oxidoreductase [bacterium]HPQ66600.1 NAD(P)-dependent oxidoreductase [bacterium]